MPYGFVRIFYFLFFILFDRQAGPFQNFNRSQVMVTGRSVSFSDPAWPPGGGVERPKQPKIPPRNIFEKIPPPQKKISVTKNFHPHAPAQPSEHSPQSSCNNK